MKTITELKKERLTIRTINPVRSRVIGMLIDGASKAAKEESREATEKDIETVAKKTYRETEKDIELIASHGDYPHELAVELSILKDFIPVEMDEAAIRKLVSELPADMLTKKNMGNIMKEMKMIEHMNTGLLSKILNETLK